MSPVPDELCTHAQLGAAIAGGFIFDAETPPKTVGMCQECVEWCCASFDNPQPLASTQDTNTPASGGTD